MQLGYPFQKTYNQDQAPLLTYKILRGRSLSIHADGATYAHAVIRAFSRYTVAITDLPVKPYFHLIGWVSRLPTQACGYMRI